MAPYVAVANVQDIPPGQVKVIEVEGRKIALCNVNGAFHAIEDRCSHDDGPLGEGTLEGQRLECPRHGAQFDVTTGRPTTLPAVLSVQTFPTQVEGGQVWIAPGPPTPERKR